MTGFEASVAVTGAATSAVGRGLGRTGLDLTVEACRAAVADAGLELRDIDGLASYPGAAVETGFSGPGTPAVHDALRLSLSWHHGGSEGPAQLGALVAAATAIAAGLADHVLVYRTVTEASSRRTADPDMAAADGFLEWLLPFGALSAANWIGAHAQRYLHENGLDRQALGTVAVNGRRHAARNPSAVFRTAITAEDHLAAPMISWPFGRLDCDVPVDGSTAFVLSRVGRGPTSTRRPVVFEAVGTASRGRSSWDSYDDLASSGPMRDAAEMMWSRTRLRPSDVRVAELYDGFSFLTLAWLEALGFAGRGQAARFIGDGTATDLTGPLPLNTSGGQLGAGRLHGFGLIHEAVLQLRGEASDRQVPGDADVAVVSNGGGPLAGCLLLRASR